MKNIASTMIKNFFIGMIVFSIAQVGLASSEKSSVDNAYKAWCSAIGNAKGNAEAVVKFYAPNAILLATVSSKILRNTHGGLNKYFESFTGQTDITCSTQELISQLYGDMAINSGFYTFSYHDKHGKHKVVHARFTFVYKKYHHKWLIVNHHSSVLPI